MAIKTIRNYQLSYDAGDTEILIYVKSDYLTNTYFPKIPTEEEANEEFGTHGLPLRLNFIFKGCTNMIASPKLPSKAVCNGTLSSQGLFYNCSELVIAPMVPRDYIGATKSLIATFYGCSKLIQAPVIPIGITNASYMFQDCAKLKKTVSLPASITNVSYLYRNATDVSGEMIVRGSPVNHVYTFRDTTKPITLYGDQATCETLAATANNGNAAWSPWYDPVPAVTDRGQGSYTTAADMTRMVRNGALAVDTYAPGRMVYQQGDIVREDEWIALVEAAQTIDPTITLSTHYANLNKIEAAFDSAL